VTVEVARAFLNVTADEVRTLLPEPFVVSDIELLSWWQILPDHRRFWLMRLRGFGGLAPKTMKDWTKESGLTPSGGYARIKSTTGRMIAKIIESRQCVQHAMDVCI